LTVPAEIHAAEIAVDRDRICSFGSFEALSHGLASCHQISLLTASLPGLDWLERS
jgi:hypothetical protein